MATATKKTSARPADERFARAGARLDDLVERAEGAGDEVKARFDRIVGTARDDIDRVRHELFKLADAHAEARRHYQAAVDAANERMETDVAIAEGRMEAELAASREAFEAAIDAQLDGWRARIEELRVRAALARMDARDKLEPLFDRIDDRLGLAVARARQMTAASDDAWATLRDGVQEAVDLLQETIDEASEQML